MKIPYLVIVFAAQEAIKAAGTNRSVEIPLTPLNIKGKVPKSYHEIKLENIVLTLVSNSFSNFLKAALRDTENIPQSVNYRVHMVEDEEGLHKTFEKC